MHHPLFCPHLSYFLHFISVKRKVSVTIQPQEQGLSCNATGKLWNPNKFQTSILAWIYSKLAPALKMPTASTRSSNYPSCFLNLSEKNAQPWKPKVNVLIRVLPCWSQKIAQIWKKHCRVQGSTGFKRLRSFTNTNTAVGTVLNRAMKLVCAFPS